MIDDSLSIHQIPLTNAAAVFIPKYTHTFREDSDYAEATTPDGIPYIRWGADDKMPYDIIDLIEADETLSTCQIWNAEMCYGQGLRYNTDNASPQITDKVNDFLLDNPLHEYYLGCCQDIKHFAFAVTVIFLSRDASRITAIQRKEACYTRFAPADKHGCPPYIVYGNFRNPTTQKKFQKIPLLSPHNPWADLQTRLGLRPGPDGRRHTTTDRTFAIVSRVPGVDSLYYPIPHYASLFRGAWYNIKRLIGIAKEAKLRNAAPIKYVIEIAHEYWEEIFKSQRVLDQQRRAQIIKQRKEKILKFLTSTENTGSVLFTGKSLSIDGAKDNPHITVRRIDSDTKEGGDWQTDIAEAINMICFTMHVHSNLVGSVPGSKQTNNSGSDKRELYTIAQALQKPYHDILFLPHHLIIRYNGWTGVHPECPLIQLTTLDEHRDARTVTLEPQNPAT